MIMRKLSVAIVGTGLWASAALLPTSLQAQGRAALVIANGAYPGESAIARAPADAQAIGTALQGLGFDVTVLSDVSGAGFMTALRETGAASQGGAALLYFIGHAGSDAGQATLFPAGQVSPAGGWSLEDVLAAIRAGGATQSVVLLDTCHGAASGAIEGAGQLPEPSEALDSVFYGAPTAPDQPCPEALIAGASMADQVLDGMADADLGLFDLFASYGDSPAALWAASTLDQPFYLVPENGVPEGLTEADYAMLSRLSPQDRERMLALWAGAGIGNTRAQAGAALGTVQNDTLVLSAPIRTLSTREVIRPTATRIEDVRVVAQEVLTLTAAAPRREFQPPAEGLPQPSIFVGAIAPPPGVTFAYDDLAARQALKAEDAEKFAALVAAGALDPPADQMARAIQTELARMACYTSRIDGAWGRGSRAAATRYFLQLGTSPETLEAEPVLYRQILLGGDVTCPAPVAAARAPARSTTTTAPRRTTTPRATAPAPAAAPARRINRGVTGTGTLR
ncbi:MAG: hypothetical protein ACJA06_000262 [Halocynthiibacter sp.]|jgi:hypothetical protein